MVKNGFREEAGSVMFPASLFCSSPFNGLTEIITGSISKPIFYS